MEGGKETWKGMKAPQKWELKEKKGDNMKCGASPNRNQDNVPLGQIQTIARIFVGGDSSTSSSKAYAKRVIYEEVDIWRGF